jgi:hypothetical protein
MRIMMKVIVPPAIEGRVLRAAFEAIGATDPECLRTDSNTARALGVRDQLRLDWPHLQFQHMGMGESVAYGMEPSRLRNDLLRVLGAAITDPCGVEDKEDAVRTLEEVATLAAMLHDEVADDGRSIACAMAATPWSTEHAYVMPGRGRIMTADADAIKGWVPDMPTMLVIKLASLENGIVRMVTGPVYGENDVVAMDVIARLRLQARFGASS